MTRRSKIPRAPFAVLALAALLGGCASFSDDGGFGPVQQAVQRHTGQPVRWVRDAQTQAQVDAEVEALLTQPLTADTAVQLALLNNRGLQATFEELGIAEADLVQAGRLANPGLSLARLERGGTVEIERGLHLSLSSLLLMPLRREMEQQRFERVRGDATQRVLALVADTRRAWVEAVSAVESLRYARQVADATEAGAELARRMAQVGNFSALQRDRELAFQADAALALARAEQQQRAARERLARLLGLWGAQLAFTLPDRLPDLPAQPRELPDIERRAVAERLDLQAAKLQVERAARAAGLTASTRWLGALELGAQRNSATGEPVQRGWELGVELPIFDGGQARMAKAQALLRQAEHQAADQAVQARSELRLAYGAYRSAWDIARYQRDEVVPLRGRIAEQNRLRYNGMLIGVFELLADARAQIASVRDAIDATRDFWLAQADLDQALLGPVGSAPRAEPGRTAASTGDAPAAH